MVALESIDGPDDLRRLTPPELDELAAEIRVVPRHPGHPDRRPPRPEPRRRRAHARAAPGLRVARATRSSSTPATRPTCTSCSPAGRTSRRLKQNGGLSGYPCRAESEHDIVENSHASTALSWADGLARASRCAAQHDRHVVAVVGDGALTGGMAWEALNNIADRRTGRSFIVVNDNERSYAPTIGGLAHHLVDAADDPGLRALPRLGA